MDEIVPQSHRYSQRGGADVSSQQLCKPALILLTYQLTLNQRVQGSPSSSVERRAAAGQGE
jgi:hypothetical protein